MQCLLISMVYVRPSQLISSYLHDGQPTQKLHENSTIVSHKPMQAGARTPLPLRLNFCICQMDEFSIYLVNLLKC